jgi:hypothetical protein
MRMKRIALAGFILAAVRTAAMALGATPDAPAGVSDIQGRTQLIASFGDFDVLAELLGHSEHVTPQAGYAGSVTLGGYYRVLKNLKIGAFYRLQDGVHHDNDWGTPTGDWSWQDVSGRLENVLMLDVSPRFLLDFLPGRNWVFMLKGRYEYNLYNDQQSILARPELTYFWIQDRVPILNVSFSYAMYFPLNFGSTLLYQTYPYLTVLWHATPDIALELGGAYKTTVWSTSSSVANWGGLPDYQVYFNSFTLTLGVVITLAF